MNRLLKICFSACFVFLVISSFTFQSDFDRHWIKWENNDKLEWSSFKGVPEKNSPFGALSGTGLYYEMAQTSEINFDFKVYSYFDKETSWVKKGDKSEKLLAHEQLHFDLTELYSRKFRKALIEFSFTKADQVEKVASELFKKYRLELNAQHDLYDKESNHSIDKTGQTKWNDLIPKALKEYRDYQSNDFSITASMRRE